MKVFRYNNNDDYDDDDDDDNFNRQDYLPMEATLNIGVSG